MRGGTLGLAWLGLASDFQGVETAREAGSRNSVSTHQDVSLLYSGWLRIAHKAKWATTFGALRFETSVTPQLSTEQRRSSANQVLLILLGNQLAPVW